MCSRRARCSAVAALVLPACALAQGYYTLTEVPHLSGHYSFSPSSLNNAGEVVGVSLGSPVSNQNPVVWRPGQGTQVLPFPPGHAYSAPMDINDAGVVCGFSMTVWNDETNPRGWKFENGAFTSFAAVSTGISLNAAGDVVGGGCAGGGELTCYFRALDDGGTTTFGTGPFSPTTRWRLIDINDGGQVLYFREHASAIRRQSDGVEMSLPPAPAPYVRTYTAGINAQGLCLARYEYNIGSQYFSRGFVWSPETGVRYIGATNNYIFPVAINASGRVVGRSGGNETGYIQMWMQDPGSPPVALETLIDPVLNIDISNVYGINDAGQILIRGIPIDAPISDYVYLLTPPQAPPGCDGDVNCDFALDGFDVEVQEKAVGGDVTDYCQPDPDFNGDFALDGFDVEAVELVVGGGDCP